MVGFQPPQSSELNENWLLKGLPMSQSVMTMNHRASFFALEQRILSQCQAWADILIEKSE